MHYLHMYYFKEIFQYFEFAARVDNLKNNLSTMVH